ncbi:MAG: GNAT family N-acetyltransferase [Chitinispirillaceae bacterium]|nr:GNAT family N-acetyltransferase [Chitinispirillaceae bacterium]
MPFFSMISTFTYRNIPRPEDILAIRSIVSSTGMFRPEEIEVAVELIEERLKKGEKSGYYFLFAENGNEVIGYTCFGPIACTVASYDLFWIAVKKEYQRKHIGEMLLKKSEEIIKSYGGKRVYIETSSRKDYLPTRNFYLKNGYIIETILKDFYDEKDNKVIFSKRLE